MIFRLTQKLSKKIETSPTEALPLNPILFADWSAHLFTADRIQFIMLTNTASLYSTLMYGRGIANDSMFLDRALEAIREFMVGDGQEFTYRRFIAPASETIYFSKALNRSVTGSINDLVYHAQMWLSEAGLSPFDTSFKLNEMPMSALNYGYPREAFKSLAVESEDAAR